MNAQIKKTTLTKKVKNQIKASLVFKKSRIQ